MEKRKSERVQFFKLQTERGAHPIWVFGRRETDSILGLLVDISHSGVQIISNRDGPSPGDLSRLTIFKNHLDDDQVLTTLVRLKWSMDEGTLYSRHGFEFVEPQTTIALVSKIMDAEFGSGEKWARCQLIAFHDFVLN